ncbi:MAG: sugar phosphate nucleotidyltransferase [Salinibacter sp.]|uniref:nucleotidyltransferase family protein n=1 Tax=Salinibacter sp. TaxID=2065818 RepID=UPI002FC3C0CB
MNAFLLCAGFGTRMRPLTADTPKSLVRVAEKPILDRLLDELTAWSALTDIHVAVNHRDAPDFHQWATAHRTDLTAAGIELHLHDDGVESPDDQLGSVGDLKFLLDEVGVPPDGALVSGGDSLYRFPLAPILNAYEGTTNDALALHEPDPARRAHSSVLRLDGATVTEVLDDPTGAASTRICPSWLLLSTEGLEAVSAYLNDGGPPDTLGGFLNRLARTHSVRAHRLPKTPNLRLHCNTPDDLERARRLLRDEPRHVLGPEAVRGCLAGAEG